MVVVPIEFVDHINFREKTWKYLIAHWKATEAVGTGVAFAGDVFKLGAALLVEGDSLAHDAKACVFCFCLSDVHVVTLNDDLAPINNVVKGPAGFKGGKEFLLSYSVLELCVVEFLKEHADYFFRAIDRLGENCSHGIFL